MNKQTKEKLNFIKDILDNDLKIVLKKAVENRCANETFNTIVWIKIAQSLEKIANKK